MCGYYNIFKELMPMKMSWNAVFDGATVKIQTNEEVKMRFGENFKTYGMDHGGHREGRRNFVKHTQYVDVDTNGSKRTRVQFNIKGQYGTVFIFAEVSDLMPSGEFMYVMVQDKRNGAVVNVADNSRGSIRKNVIFSNSLWTNPENPNLLKSMSIWSM